LIAITKGGDLFALCNAHADPGAHPPF